MLVLVIGLGAAAGVLVALLARARSRPPHDDTLSAWHEGLDALDRIDRRRLRRSATSR